MNVNIYHPGDKHPAWRGGKPRCAICGVLTKTYSANKCIKCLNLGRVHSKEHGEKISNALKGRGLGFKKGHLPWNTGKKRPEFSAEKHHWWKGGKKKHSRGYVAVYSPGHPYAHDRNYVYEHRLVMEELLGRYLKPIEHIHHKNGIKDDNRLENLEVVGMPHLGKICCPYCQKEFLIK